jgi:DNA polymerase-3 subunit epsilon
VLYVGKTTDLRARVRSYFYGDPRKQVEDLLGHATSVEGFACATELEAQLVEARLIVRHEPPYNRRGKGWRRYAYLKLDTAEAYRRLKVVRETKRAAASTSARSDPRDWRTW